MPDRTIYFFGAGQTEGDGTMKDLLGGKGAGLAEMARIGVPVPPGFTITTEVCRLYLQGSAEPEGLRDAVAASLARLEEATGKTFGGGESPLLVSVRSGAKFSMPGMMDTVLNLGLNDTTAEGLIHLTGDERFVYDVYRRLVQMFGSVVVGIEDEAFEDKLTEYKTQHRYNSDVEMRANDWKYMTEEFKRIYREHVGHPFPNDPVNQLRLAVEAVFKSW